MRLTFEAGPAALTGLLSGSFIVASPSELFDTAFDGCLQAVQIAGDGNPFGVAVTIEGHRCFIWEGTSRKAKITCIRGELVTTAKHLDLSRDRLVALCPLSLYSLLKRNHARVGQQVYAPGWPGKGVLEMSCVEGDLFITGEIGIEVKTSAE